MSPHADNASAPALVEPRRRRRRTRAERERRAARVQDRIERVLEDRSQAWAEGGRDPFLVHRQDGDQAPGRGADAYMHREVDGSLKGLHVERRAELSGGERG